MKGLPYSGPMVLAWVADIKDLTRRLMNPQPTSVDTANHTEIPYNGTAEFLAQHVKPFYRPGETVYIKEAWRYYDWTEDGFPFIQYRCDEQKRLIENIPEEWSDRIGDIWAALSDKDNFKIHGAARDPKWRSPRFMPEWASRSKALIVSVRPEQIQSITHEEAAREGIHSVRNWITPLGAAGNFRLLWESIHPGSWERNDWVWRIELEKQP